MFNFEQLVLEELLLEELLLESYTVDVSIAFRNNTGIIIDLNFLNKIFVTLGKTYSYDSANDWIGYHDLLPVLDAIVRLTPSSSSSTGFCASLADAKNVVKGTTGGALLEDKYYELISNTIKTGTTYVNQIFTDLKNNPSTIKCADIQNLATRVGRSTEHPLKTAVNNIKAGLSGIANKIEI